jgi:hypothetical protein
MRAAQKTNAGLREHAALMRDLSTIAFYRAVALLRRLEPVPAFSQHAGPGRLWISLSAGSGETPKTVALLTRPLETPTQTCNLKQQKCYLCPEPKVLPMS